MDDKSAGMMQNSHDRPLLIGSDHAGFDLKEHIRATCLQRDLQVKDFGCYSTISYDYPNIAEAIARQVGDDFAARAILICGSGIGMSIAANRFSRVYAALVHTPEAAKLAREHNKANILVLAGRTTLPDTADAIINAWLTTPFAGGRHYRRLQMIDKVDKST